MEIFPKMFRYKHKTKKIYLDARALKMEQDYYEDPKKEKTQKKQMQQQHTFFDSIFEISNRIIKTSNFVFDLIRKYKEGS